MKKYRVTVNGTVYEIELEELTGAAPAAPAAPKVDTAQEQAVIAAIIAAVTEDLGPSAARMQITNITKI